MSFEEQPYNEPYHEQSKESEETVLEEGCDTLERSENISVREHPRWAALMVVRRMRIKVEQNKIWDT